MQVVDPHIHLWNPQKVSYPWLEKPCIAYSGDNRRLPQPYEPLHFLRDIGDVDVHMSVHVEANPSDSVEEASWLQALADHPANLGHPHGIIAYADLSSPGAPAVLENLAAFRNLRGIRQILNVHADPQYDYVGRHYLREPMWRENLRCLAGYRWSFDLQLYPSQVADALPVVDASPEIFFIVNHAGMFVDRNQVHGWSEWRNGLRALALRDNVALKISGLAMFDHQWTVESFRPYVLESIDTFGPGRCMFASNFPVDGLHGAYEALWTGYAEIVSGASSTERKELFASNAVRYYRLPAA